ncbi:MAG: DUF305 domain-containing protein [Gemmatimonadota bacterium]
MKRALQQAFVWPFLFLAACASAGPVASPGAAHHPAQQLPATAGAGYAAADVRFMQHMIGHHAQALVMAAMAPTHGAGSQLLKLAEKIDISQRDEIGMMEAWLVERNQPLPDDHAMHGMLMPGMLTPEQLGQLDAARGLEFERLFLRFMIGHHEGALQMVDELFDHPTAAQDPDIFRFATDVVADQLAEIDQMRYLLDTLDPNPGREST